MVRELVDEARKRGVRIKLVLLDRAFFTVECINLLKGLGLEFVMPCVCNERVQGAVDSFGKEGAVPFSIRDSSKNEASFTMVVYWSREKGKFIPFATNVEGNARRLVGMIPREYRRRWGIETSFRKVKEVFPMTTSPSPAIRLAILHGGDVPLQPLAAGEHAARRRAKKTDEGLQGDDAIHGASPLRPPERQALIVMTSQRR